MGGGNRVALDHADDIYASDSRLPAGDITSIASQLPLLSNVFGLRARSLRALRGDERKLADDQPDPSLSSLSAGRLRSGPLNGQAFFSGPVSIANRNSDLTADFSTGKTSAEHPEGRSRDRLLGVLHSEGDGIINSSSCDEDPGEYLSARSAGRY